DSKGQGGKGAGPASSAGPPGGQPPRKGGGPNANQDDSHSFAQTITSLQRLSLRTAQQAREQAHLATDFWLIPGSCSPSRVGLAAGREYATEELRNNAHSCLEKEGYQREIQWSMQILNQWLRLAFHEKGREFIQETIEMFKITEAYKPKGQEDDGNSR
ncbi:unnamed protein product, partial [Prorocentrum cordatum]